MAVHPELSSRHVRGIADADEASDAARLLQFGQERLQIERGREHRHTSTVIGPGPLLAGTVAVELDAVPV